MYSRYTRVVVGALLFSTLFFSSHSQAGFQDWLKGLVGEEGASTATAAASALSQTEVADGLREALGQGVTRAVQTLGREDGFLANANVRIPIPEHLTMVEQGLRTVGQDAIADQFVSSLNKAAERAVPEAAQVFAGAISNMTIDDAKAVLNGGDTAATDFLRRTSGAELKQRFLPVVEGAVREVGVTRVYEDLIDKAGPAAAFIKQDMRLGNYVTEGALDGLFYMIGQEEQKIRADPVARSTDLLKKVFDR